MRHDTTTISGHRGTHNAEVAVFWIFAGVIMLIAIGDALAVLAAAIAIVTAISWIYRKVEHRSERSGAETARVTRLHPELTGQRDSENTSAPASRRFRRAA
ncbi:MAG TPA: hypothetical protein VGI68_04555 [Mycobacterium sp.]|jgi:hypothetical protein